MRRIRGACLVSSVVVATALAACSPDDAGTPVDEAASPSRSAPSVSASESAAPDEDQVDLDELLDEVVLQPRIGPEFEMRDVRHTSPTEGMAIFLRDTGRARERGTIIATTDDGWAHSTRILINERTSEDTVEATPLGNGEVAVKVGDEDFPTTSYPPFVLRPGGEVDLLRIARARPLSSGSVLLEEGRWGFLYGIGRSGAGRLWAYDSDVTEIFAVEGSRFGDAWQHVAGRGDEILSVDGFSRKLQSWSFDSSRDNGRTWTTTDVELASSRYFEHEFVPVPVHAVGPGRLQAVAMTRIIPDVPLILNELWTTDDERSFRKVDLPWDDARFGGIAYASDGALLLAELPGPDTFCDGSPRTCSRAGRIWRLPPRGGGFELMPSAPRLFDHFSSVGIHTSGGMIVARTGYDSVAVSRNGYAWSEVTPGR